MSQDAIFNLSCIHTLYLPRYLSYLLGEAEIMGFSPGYTARVRLNGILLYPTRPVMVEGILGGRG